MDKGKKFRLLCPVGSMLMKAAECFCLWLPEKMWHKLHVKM